MYRRVLRSGSVSRVINLQHTRRTLDPKSDVGSETRGLSHSCENSLINYGDEVREARKSGSPIVALESTIITHGMPYPDNLTTAIRVEEIVREQVRKNVFFRLYSMRFFNFTICFFSTLINSFFNLTIGFLRLYYMLFFNFTICFLQLYYVFFFQLC